VIAMMLVAQETGSNAKLQTNAKMFWRQERHSRLKETGNGVAAKGPFCVHDIFLFISHHTGSRASAA
jgi:hypothetical protein